MGIYKKHAPSLKIYLVLSKTLWRLRHFVNAFLRFWQALLLSKIGRVFSFSLRPHAGSLYQTVVSFRSGPPLRVQDADVLRNTCVYILDVHVAHNAGLCGYVPLASMPVVEFLNMPVCTRSRSVDKRAAGSTCEEARRADGM